MQRRSISSRKQSRALFEALEGRALFSTVYAVTGDNTLITFDSTNPSVTTAPVAFTGLSSGERIVGIDFDPSGTMIAVSNQSHLYKVDTSGGGAALLKIPGPTTEATFTSPLSGTQFGVDENPATNLIDVVSNTEQHLQIDPTTGNLTGNTTPGVHYAAGDIHYGGNPNILGIAWDHNFPGATTSTLYGLDSQFGSLVTIDEATGNITTVGSTTQSFVDGGFDITSQYLGNNFGWAALSADGATSDFYSVDLTTGKATDIGKIGSSGATILVTSIAMAPIPTQFSFAPADMSVAENDPSGQVTVTVTRSGVGTTPASVDYRTVDDTATAGADYVAKSGTLTFAPGEFTKTFNVPIIDDSIHEGNEDFTLQLLNPSGGTIGTGTGTVTILDNDAASIFSFSASDYTVREDGTATITVVRTGDLTKQNTVDFSTNDGTGHVGSDYVGTSGTLVFPIGATTETFTVQPINDFTYEGDRTVVLTLTDPSTGAEVSPSGSNSTLTITDDESQPTLSISGPASVVEGNTGSTTLLYTVTLDGLTTQNVNVNYSTSDGTAMAADGDYQSTSGSLTFVPGGPSSQTIAVTVNGDTKFEGDEVFSVNLFSPIGATLANAQASTTIVDDDAGTKLQADPVNPGKTLLTVVGTPGDDVITVVKAGGKKVQVFINDASFGVFNNPGRIAIYGKDGNDDIRVAPNIKISCELHGDAGDDTLQGGGGRDILLGGTGTDALLGNGGDDILIGGPSIYDNNTPALAAIMREWTSGQSYKKRVNFLSSGGGLNGSFVLNQNTIATDGVVDIMSGGSGNDFFPFATGDTITDGRANERGVPTT